MRVAVIGAGITGLSAALHLRSRGAQVTVFEAGAREGGVITTVRKDGFLIEAGPTSLTATEALEGLITQLGLDAARLPALETAKRRYIVREGAPVALPDGPLSLVTTRALSGGAKLRLLREPFVAAARGEGEESLAGLVRRRLGEEILTYLVDPAISGIYAGDPERLSVRHAMPMLHDAERKHGSLLRGAPREMRARRGTVRQRGITSFRDGLATLPRAMADSLGSAVRLGAAVTRAARAGDAWRVEAADGGADADAVICTAPAHAFGALGLEGASAADLARIAAIRHPAVSTLALGYRRADVAHPLDGFGMLVPAVERRHVLGVLFSSSVFAGRAPEGHVLLTCFVGGMRNPGLGAAGTEALLPLVRADLEALLGVRGAPMLVHHQRWPAAIPQYELGHQEVVDAAARIERAMPGVVLAGQWRAGVSIGDCIAQGQEAAARTLAGARA